MDEFFIRELVIFGGIAAIFIGSVPFLIRGHYAESIESTLDVSGRSAGSATDEGVSTVKVSRKRKARARDAVRKSD